MSSFVISTQTRLTVIRCPTKNFPNKPEGSDWLVCFRGNQGSNYCKGDSGGWVGSLYGFLWHVDGVVSFTRSGCTSPMGTTSVAYFHEWINVAMDYECDCD